MNNLNLPKPECRLGYTRRQIEQIMGSREDEFMQWMYGQTAAICDGKFWNHSTGQQEVTGEGPHGYVIYRGDVERFLLHKPIID